MCDGGHRSFTTGCTWDDRTKEMNATAVNAPTIRPATFADAEAIHDLTQAAYAEYSTTPTPSSAHAETTREVFEGLYGGRFRAAIAEIDGKTVGSVRYRVDNRGLYFFRLAVHPGHRRQGEGVES